MIQVSHLRKSFGGADAVRDVSFTAPNGCITGILGENGAGNTRRMHLFLIIEVIITIVFCGGTLGWTLLTRRTDALVLAIGVWFFTAAAWVISYLLRRDAWAPATLTTAAFIDLSILRCRRRYESVAGQALLYVLILTFDLAWIYAGRADHIALLPFLASQGVAWVWVVTALLAAAAVTQRRRLRRELQGLESLRRQFDRATSS